MRNTGGIGRGIARIAQSPVTAFDMPAIDRTAGAGDRDESDRAAAPAPRGIRTSRIGRSRATARRNEVRRKSADMKFDDRHARCATASAVQRGVLDHPLDKLIERYARMCRKLGDERSLGHAGLGVDFQAGKTLRPLATVVVAEICTRHAPASQGLMCMKGQSSDLVGKLLVKF
jgi:hypothetical protein